MEHDPSPSEIYAATRPRWRCRIGWHTWFRQWYGGKFCIVCLKEKKP